MNGIGISPAAPDHKEKRSTNFAAASSRFSSVISALTEPVALAGSFFSATPDPVVSCAIRAPLLLTHRNSSIYAAYARLSYLDTNIHTPAVLGVCAGFADGSALHPT